MKQQEIVHDPSKVQNRVRDAVWRPNVNKVECVERLFHTSIPPSQPSPLKPTKGEPGCDERTEFIMGTRWLSSSGKLISQRFATWDHSMSRGRIATHIVLNWKDQLLTKRREENSKKLNCTRRRYGDSR